MNEAIIEYNKGTKFLNGKKWEKADRHFRAAEKLGLESPELYLNWGNIRKAIGDYRDAARKYEKCLAIRPDYKLVYNNLGLIYHGLGEDHKALEIFEAGHALDNTYKDIIWNKSLAQLKLASTAGVGWSEAWRNYNIRFFKESATVKLKCDFGTLTHWKGEPGRVLVVSEQGIGDTIQFMRYINYYGYKYNVSFGVQTGAALHSLYRDVLDPRHTIAEWHKWQDFDYFIPICSFGALANEIAPSIYIPKFSVPDIANIGFVWEGNPEHGNNHNRSVDVGYFRRFLKYGAVPFQWRQNAFGIKTVCTGDFRDTAMALSGIKLLISVDTSIVHLAGSMGIPTWCLMPKFDTDWRWGTSGEKSLWYDTVRVIRNSGEWIDVFDNVENKLIKEKDDLGITW